MVDFLGLDSLGFKDILPIITGVIGGLFGAQVANRKIEIENITQERAKWREKIRENAEKTSKAILNRDGAKLLILRSRFRLMLNPDDKKNRKIIQCFGKALAELEELKVNSGTNVSNSTSKFIELEVEFTKHVAALLKHDWERAKNEAKPWFKSADSLNTVLVCNAILFFSICIKLILSIHYAFLDNLINLLFLFLIAILFIGFSLGFVQTLSDFLSKFKMNRSKYLKGID